MQKKESIVGFNRVFKQANESRHRYRLFKGSAGSGKSVNVAQMYIMMLGDPAYKGCNLLCVRKVNETNRNSTFAELKGAIFRIYGEDYEQYWHITENPFLIRSKVTGNEVIFRGVNNAKDREKVKSITFTRGKLTWIWVEESTELLESDIDILDDRLRGQLEGDNAFYQMTFTFNPIEDTHWIKAKYFDIEHPDIFTCHSTYQTNRFIDAAYHRRMMMRKERDPEGYKVYGEGEWGSIGGNILKKYKIHDFNRSESRFDSLFYGQDFGFNHANVILDVRFYDGELYICDEIYVHEHTTDDVIALAKEKKLDKTRRMWSDSADPGAIRTWRRAGYNAVPVKKGAGSVKAQIDFLKKTRIHIHPDCYNTIKEIKQWKYELDRKTNKYTDKPVEVFDDAMAALRYAIETIRQGTATNRYD